MEHNYYCYYCNGKWFKTYDEATRYACRAITLTGEYHVIYTRDEMDAVINHELECGK